MSFAAQAEALHAQAVTATADMRPADGARLLRKALSCLDSLPPAHVGELRGRILVSLAHAEAEQGQVDLGLELLAEAEPLLPPPQQGVLHGQRGLMLMRIGAYDQAVTQYGKAIASLAETSQPQDLARALLNRGVLHMSTAQAAAARADLTRCLQVAQEHQLTRMVAKSAHNLAYLDYLAGDLPSALRGYAGLSPQYAQMMPAALPVLAVDRARALLAAGLFAEADRELNSALADFEKLRLTQDYAEAQLARAQAALLANRPQVASQLAAAAKELFLRRRNRRWAAQASLVQLRAEFACGTADPSIAGRAGALARALRGFGMTEDGRVADLIAARALARQHRLPSARAALARSGPCRPPDRLDTRLLTRLARAEIAPRQRFRHLLSGLNDLKRHRSQLGDLDLQTGSSALGRDLAYAGLSAALASGSAPTIFRWSELVRAQALLLPRVLPPADPEAAAMVESLRHARVTLRQAELEGKPATAVRAQAESLRRAIRERGWATTGPGTSATVAPLPAVRAELADRAMVVYLRDADRLRALVMVNGAATLVTLGSYAAAEGAISRLRADLDAAAGRVMRDRLATALQSATARDAAALTAIILEPLLPLVRDRELVVIPTGSLVTVPWAALEQCAGRPVTVAASATLWLSARTRPMTDRALLVSGPGNARGDAEVEAIAELYPHATVLTGQSATPGATLAELDGVGIAHLAAHGHHEADNALFSSLELAGGPLLGYDLSRLPNAPGVAVLSSCDLGLNDVRPGDETLGMATALLASGTRTVIASVCRVADEAAMAMMTDFHRSAVAGQSPAVALAAAKSASPRPAFVCFGAG